MGSDAGLPAVSSLPQKLAAFQTWSCFLTFLNVIWKMKMLKEKKKTLPDNNNNTLSKGLET